MKCKIILFTLILMDFPVRAQTDDIIHYGEFTLYMDKKDSSVIHIVNGDGASDVLCKINNWDGNHNSGRGSISITNDEKGVLIYSTNKYLSTDELMQCNESGIELHTIPQSDDKLDTIVDINFDKRLALLMALEDVRVSTYTAIVSSFDSEKNLLSGPGFFSETNSNIPFNTGWSWYGGKISLDGKYVYPYYLDCAVDSFPGLWDIKKIKRLSLILHWARTKLRTDARSYLTAKPRLKN